MDKKMAKDYKKMLKVSAIKEDLKKGKNTEIL